MVFEECVPGRKSHYKNMPQTSNSRTRIYDAIRAIAIARVFFWHATGWDTLTWFAALPVMFYLNGLFMASSLEKSGMATTLHKRLRRLMWPYWVFAASMLLLMYLYDGWRVDGVANGLAWVFPYAVPQGALWQQGWLTEPLWYVRTYVWLVITTPLLWLIVKRGKLGGVLAWSSGAWLTSRFLGTSWWAVQDYMAFAGCYMLGMVGARQAWRVSQTTIIGVLGGIGVLASVLRDGMPTGAVNHDHALQLSLGFLLVSGLESGRRVLEAAKTTTPASARKQVFDLVRGACWRLVSHINTRSVSIYLWHPALIGASFLLAGRIGLGVWVAPAAIVVSIALTYALTSLVGVVEDYAAAKDIRWSVWRGALPRSVLTIAGAAVLFLSTNAPAHQVLPPPPSKAPSAPEFVAEGADQLAENLLSWGGGVQPGNFAAGTDHETPAKAANKTPETSVPVKISAGGKSENPQEPGAVGVPKLEPIPNFKNLAPEDEEAAAKAESVLTNWVSQGGVGGIEIAALKPGVWRFEFGVDGDGSRVDTRDTIPLASITKTFTAALLLRAIDEGLLDPYAPIGQLEAAPWFTMAERLTASQLLTHRSGLANYTETAAWLENWQSIDGWKPALEAIMHEGFVSTPGTVVRYSSSNYIVAGLLAAQIYGKPIEEVIEKSLLDPLGLRQTVVRGPIPGSPGTGTGNMRASVSDLARWGMVLWRDSSVLGSIGNDLMRNVDPATMMGYGSFAWCPCRGDSRGVQWSAIGANGAEATVRYYPALDLILAMRIPGGVDERVDRMILAIVDALL